MQFRYIHVCQVLHRFSEGVQADMLERDELIVNENKTSKEHGVEGFLPLSPLFSFTSELRLCLSTHE